MSQNPKLTVLTAAIGLPEDYTVALRENRALEAYAYDYEYCELHLSLDAGRALVWTKIAAIQELLAKGKQRLVWMDADAFFTTKRPFETVSRIKLKREQRLFSIFERKDIIFSDDHSLGDPCGINLGVIAMKNSNWTRHFWQDIWNSYGPATAKLGLEEQSAVCLARKRDPDGFRHHTVVVEHRVINNIGSYKGDFIAHIAGGGDPDKYEKLLPHVKKANKDMAGGAGVKAFFHQAAKTGSFDILF